jgi:hypothetical protein
MKGICGVCFLILIVTASADMTCIYADSMSAVIYEGPPSEGSVVFRVIPGPAEGGVVVDDLRSGRLFLLTPSSGGGLKWQRLAPSEELWIPRGRKDRQNWTDPRNVYRGGENSVLVKGAGKRGRTEWREVPVMVDGLPPSAFVFQYARTKNAYLIVDIAAVSPESPSRIFAMFEVYVPKPGAPHLYESRRHLPGMYVSEDGGHNWRMFAEQLRAVDTGARPPDAVLGISPSNPKRMVSYAEAGLVESRDGGRTWSPLPGSSVMGQPAKVPGMPERTMIHGKVIRTRKPDWLNFAVSSVAFDPKDEETLYLETNKGVYRTQDGGRTWCLLPSKRVIDYASSVVVDRANPRVVYVGTWDGVLVSFDRGCTSKSVRPPGAGGLSIRTE